MTDPFFAIEAPDPEALVTPPRDDSEVELDDDAVVLFRRIGGLNPNEVALSLAAPVWKAKRVLADAVFAEFEDAWRRRARRSTTGPRVRRG